MIIINHYFNYWLLNIEIIFRGWRWDGTGIAADSPSRDCNLGIPILSSIVVTSFLRLKWLMEISHQNDVLSGLQKGISEEFGFKDNFEESGLKIGKFFLIKNVIFYWKLVRDFTGIWPRSWIPRLNRGPVPEIMENWIPVPVQSRFDLVQLPIPDLY